MRSFGPIYRLTISGRILWLTVIFALAFAAVSVLAINRGMELHTENRELRYRLERATRAVDDIRFQSKVLDHYQQLVGELNKADQKKPTDQPARSDSSVMVASPVETARPPESTGADPMLAAVNQGLVDADKLTMEPETDNKAVRFQFNLNNLRPEIRSVSGFLFLVLGNPAANPPTVAVYPEVEFKQGKPADFKKGSQFNIRHGKTVRGRIDKLTGASTYKQAWIYAFSDDGQLLLRKMLTAEHG